MTFPGAPAAEPAAAEPAPTGQEGAGDGGQAQAPAGADPRVLEQMQAQMEQFGGTLSQMAEYMPALQQIAGQGGQQQGEPSLEDLAAQFFAGGDPNYADPYAGQAEPRFDPFTGEPIAQQPQFDPYTGQPIGQQPAQQQQAGLQGDPSQLIDLFRQVVREETAPFQQERQQERWNALYKELPQFNDPKQAPQIAESVARAARLFGRTEDEARAFANNPEFARWAYFASVNEAQARGELPAGATDGPTPIEAGSGASAGGGQEIDQGDAIVNAGSNGAGAAGAHFR